MYSSVLTPHQLLPVPVYDNVSALTNRLDTVAQREPIEELDDHHYASIDTSVSKEQEVPGSGGQSVKTAVFYSLVNIQRVNAVPGESDPAETPEFYSTIK
ncbi:unnamed protein product [Gadus morhua 'NCC']